MKIKFNISWLWLGVGVYPKIKMVDVHLPFTLITIGKTPVTKLGINHARLNALRRKYDITISE